MKKSALNICIIFILIVIAMLSGCSDERVGLLVKEEDIKEAITDLMDPDVKVNSVVSMQDMIDSEDLMPLDIDESEIKMVSVVPRNPKDRPLRVGFSQMEVNNPWRVCENSSIFEEANRLGIELFYRDALSSIVKQNADILELLEEDLDYLLVAPREVTGLQEGLSAAKEAGVPVFLLDRMTEATAGEDYVTCIMGDFIDIGRRAALKLKEVFGGEKIHVLEVSGTKESSVAQDLSNGFRQIANPLGWTITTIDGDFGFEASTKPLEEILQKEKDVVQAVFCHVDSSAIAALQALKTVGATPGTDVLNNEIPIVSMCGYRDAFKAIIAGEMLATVECSPRFGPITFYYIQKLEAGEAIRSRIVMRGKIFDVDNALELIDVYGY